MATKKKQFKVRQKRQIDTNKYISVITTEEDGTRKFNANVGDYLVIERFQSTGNTFNVCIVKEFFVDEKTKERHVKVWDDTRGQWFYFSYDAVNVPNIYKN